MTAPRLSVAMNVHNGMPYVEESVRAILAQTCREFEFVIGDDGSFDGTSELLRRLAREDPRIRLLRRDRKSGLAHSANWVIGEARAPLVAMAHADDLSLPGRLEAQMGAFAAEPDAVLVATLCEGIDEQGRVVRPFYLSQLGTRSRFAPYPHSSIMFSREAFEAAGGYRPEAEYWEDLDLYYRLSRRGRIFVVPEPLCRIRYARTSARVRDRAREVEDAVDLMYRAAAAQWEGRDHTIVARDPDERLHPRVFVARGWNRVWNGKRPAVLRRMLRRARLRADRATAGALIWALWAETSPRSLRLAVRTVMDARNRLAGRQKEKLAAVEWLPRARD